MSGLSRERGAVTDVLVIDDAPAVAASLAHDLAAAGHRPRVALTVAAALAELASARPDAVVLDHGLDADASLLRHALVHARLPVLVVSGLDDEAAASVAAAHGWSYLAKPPDALTAAVAHLLTQETAPMPDDPQRATVAPPAPDAPLPSPPSAPDGDSVSPLAATNPQVAIAEALYRTVRRVVATLGLTGLAVLFELRGHTVPLPIVIGLTALGIGLSGAMAALKKRPGVAAGGAAGLAVLALSGTALGLDGASTLATLGAGAIPVVDLIADRARS